MLRLKRFSYRFAEQVLDSKLALKQEIEKIITDPSIDISTLSRPNFNKILDENFSAAGWGSQPPVYDDPIKPRIRQLNNKTHNRLIMSQHSRIIQD